MHCERKFTEQCELSSLSKQRVNHTSFLHSANLQETWTQITQSWLVRNNLRPSLFTLHHSRATALWSFVLQFFFQSHLLLKPRSTAQGQNQKIFHSHPHLFLPFCNTCTWTRKYIILTDTWHKHSSGRKQPADSTKFIHPQDFMCFNESKIHSTSFYNKNIFVLQWCCNNIILTKHVAMKSDLRFCMHQNKMAAFWRKIFA